MDIQKVLHYRRRAEELVRLGDIGIDFDSMAWAQEVDPRAAPEGEVRLCPNAAGVLYVHAGIAMTDAVLTFLTGDRSTAQDHGEAIAKLQKECGRYRRTADGVKHFRWLVQNKDFFAYDDKRVSLNDAKEAQTKVQRFLTWAFKAFPEIAADE